MVRYFVRISYIGTKYRGTQRLLENPNETIQGALETGLRWLNPANNPLTSFASRTDKGVHALMNAFHVDLEHRKQDEVFQPHIVRSVLNSYLQENDHEILVHSCSVVPETFHVRKCVKWRSYRYRLAILKPMTNIKYSDLKQQFGNILSEYLPISEINRCYIVPCDLNVNIVKDVVNLYTGSHDFATFTKYTLRDSWRITKRVMDEFKFYELPPYSYLDNPHFSNVTFWEFYIKSTSFLYHQIRKMVGSAVSAGFGNLSVAEIQEMLESPNPSCWVKSQLAPACGLYLAHLEYDKEGFTIKDTSNCNEDSNKLEKTCS